MPSAHATVSKRPHLAGVQIAREDFNLARQLAAANLWSMKTTFGVAIRRLAAEHGLAAAKPSRDDAVSPTAGASSHSKRPAARGRGRRS